MKTFIESLQWRYATKKFDASKKISADQLHILKEALRLSPTSYGLQPVKYLIIENPEIREQLKDKSYNQTQITDASHLFVLCTNVEVPNEQIDTYIQLIAQERKVSTESIEGFGNYMKTTLGKLSPDEISIWTAKQAYIALGMLLTACATLEIDSTPMEGFDPKGYDEVLNLSAQNLKATLVCPVGYRHHEDANQSNPKVRQASDSIFEII